MWKKFVEELKKRFEADDKVEPFVDDEYVKETKRIYQLLLDDGDVLEHTDKAVYDIVNQIFHEMEKRKVYEETDDYQTAYNILMDYWDDLSPESKEEAHVKLNAVGL